MCALRQLKGLMRFNKFEFLFLPCPEPSEPCHESTTPRPRPSHPKVPHPYLGRLYQVEYAMEAISHAGTCLGIVCTDGVLLAAERRIASPLLDQSKSSEKIFPISDDIWCAVAGVTSDANLLIDWARTHAAKWRISHGHEIRVEQLAEALANLKQSYTQHGGMRPFGASFLLAGWDKHFGFQLYQTDPSGNYSGWLATCIGANQSTAHGILKTELTEPSSNTTESALKLLFRVLAKTIEGTAQLSAEKRSKLLFS